MQNRIVQLATSKLMLLALVVATSFILGAIYGKAVATAAVAIVTNPDRVVQVLSVPQAEAAPKD